MHPSTSAASNHGDTDGHPDAGRFRVPTSRGKIRIIKTPEGQAPFSIRKRWIGVEIPTVQFESKPIAKYIVRVEDALAALAKKWPSAAEWWKKIDLADKDFAFRADEVKEIEEVHPRL